MRLYSLALISIFGWMAQLYAIDLPETLNTQILPYMNFDSLTSPPEDHKHQNRYDQAFKHWLSTHPVSSNDKPLMVISLSSNNSQGADITFPEQASAINVKDIQSPEQAQALADRYQALAKAYEKLAKEKFDSQQSSSTKQKEQLAQQKAEQAQKQQEQLQKNKEEDIEEAIDLAGDPVVSEDIKEQEKSPFDGSNFSFGGTNTTGNTQTLNITLKGLLNYIPKGYDARWENNLTTNYAFQQGGARGSEDVGSTQTNRFRMAQNSNYFFTAKKRNGITWTLSYLNDKFDGFDYITEEKIGYLRRVYSTETLVIDSSIAPGLQQFRTQETGEFENIPSISLKLNLEWNITTDTTLTNDTSMVSSSQTTLTSNDITLATAIWKDFQLNTSFIATYSSKPQPNKVHTNTTTQVTIQYNF